MEVERVINSWTKYIDELFEKLRNIGLFINDAQNGEVYPNRYWYNWGYQAEDMKENRFMKYVHPEDAPLVRDLSVTEDKKLQESGHIAFRLRTKDGEWRWVLSTAVSVLKDKSGKVKQYIGFDTDITEEKEAKRKLKAALEETKAEKEKAEAHALEATTMREIAAIVSSSLDLDKTIEAILDQAKRLIPFDTASVQILENNHLTIIGGRGWKDLGKVIGYRWKVPGENPNTVVVKTKKPFILGEISEQLLRSFDQLPEEYTGKSWLGIPLIFRDEVIGILTFDKNTEHFFTYKHANVGTVFASHVAIAVHNASIFEKTKEIALTDPLTKAKNRRAFFDFMAQQDKVFKRYNSVFSLLMIDIDFFKNINDRFGHQAGDNVLKDLVEIIKSDLRDSDIICRYGGEEFAVLLPSIDEEAAFEIAERIRMKVEGTLLIAGSASGLTVSIGCADCRGPHIDGVDSLIFMADKALYHAKECGRNRCVQYSKLCS